MGVLNSEIKHFPMKYLSDIYLVDRGDNYVVVTKNACVLPSIFDFTCMDRECWYLI